MSSRVRRLAIALIFMVIVALSGCSGGSTSTGGGSSDATPTPIPPPPVAEKPTYTVKRGEVVDSLSFTGRVAPSVEEELWFRVDGRVKKVHVERNQVVEAGTLLAELDNDDLLRQLDQAKLELESAELSLKSAQDTRDFNIAKAKLALEIQNMELDRMIAGMNNDPAIKTARANLQKSEAAVKVAQREYDIKARRADVMASNEALILEQKTLDLELAQASLARAQQAYKGDQVDIEIKKKEIQLSEMDLARLEQQQDPGLLKSVERAKLVVERLQSQVGDTQVVSPIAGKITSVSAYDGRTVTAFKPVFIVADEAQIEITAEPMSSQLQRLAEGMSASIVLSSYPGKELKAKIEQLPYPYGKGGGSADVEEADKLSHISFDPEDLKIEPGDLVKVIVTLEQKDNVLWLPPAAIRTFSGRKFVVIEEEGRQRRADVTIGIESAERVEIKDGVEENQIVVGQ
jgi:multidrug efflux pump subunit AcrA (membrane-fusion protein)